MAAAISSVPTAHASGLIAYFNSPQLPGTSTVFPGAYELLSASLSLSSNVVIGQGISSVVQPGKVSELSELPILCTEITLGYTQ